MASTTSPQDSPRSGDNEIQVRVLAAAESSLRRGSVESQESHPTKRRSSFSQRGPGGRKSSILRQGAAIDPDAAYGNMNQFLLEASSIESRLRQHIVELMEPTIKKQVILDRSFKEFKASTLAMQSSLDENKIVGNNYEALQSTIDSLRVEQANWDKERHDHEMEVSNRVSAQEMQINSLRQSLELLKGSESVERTLKNFGDMLARYKDESTDVRNFCVERLDLNRDKIAKLRDEFERRTGAMENQMHSLQDMQRGTNKSMAHINEIVEGMNGSVKQSCEGVADLWRAKASVQCLEQQQRDLTEFMRHVNGVCGSLKMQCGSLVDDVKDHFETATTIVGRSTAQQMEFMRNRAEEDRERVDALRTEVDGFVRFQKTGLDKFGSELESTRGTTKEGILEVTNSIARLRQERDIDRKNLQIETAQLRKGLREVGQLAEYGGGSTPGSGPDDTPGGGVAISHVSELHHKSDAMATFVESAWMGLACDLQDEKDRDTIGLFGAKTAAMQPDKVVGLPDIALKKSSTVPSPAHSPRKSKKAPGYYGDAITGFTEPVISIDSRCLSCSGTSATVLAGFKMACLHYQPSPVEYDGAFYSRSELVQKRMELLQQARVALNPHARVIE